jgi:hypothetical protein
MGVLRLYLVIAGGVVLFRIVMLERNPFQVVSRAGSSGGSYPQALK